MDGIIQTLPPYFRKWSTYIDFEGQAKAERIFQVILIASGIIGFFAGYATQKISYTVYTIGIGFVLSFIICLPPWPMFRRHPLKSNVIIPSKNENKKRR